MRRTKSKKLIAEVGRTYADELIRKFPGVEPEIIIPGIDGTDVWIRIEYPDELSDLEDEILDETAVLNFHFYDDIGVSTVATVGPKMPEPAVKE